MNPHMKNKVDVKSLSPEEQRLFRLYGKLPSRSDHFAKHLKDRKYFDSGDYAMSKAGKGDGVDAGAVGSQHPVPENIPHLSTSLSNSSQNGGTGGTPIGVGSGVNVSRHSTHGSIQGLSGSPIKESNLQNETTHDEEDEKTKDGKSGGDVEGTGSAEPGLAGEGSRVDAS